MSEQQHMLPGLGRRAVDLAHTPEQKADASIERLEHTRIRGRKAFSDLTQVTAQLAACTKCCTNDEAEDKGEQNGSDIDTESSTIGRKLST